MGGRVGQPKNLALVLSRAACGGEASTPTAQHDGPPDSDRQWGVPKSPTVGGRVEQAKNWACCSEPGRSPWKCSVDAERTA